MSGFVVASVDEQHTEMMYERDRRFLLIVWKLALALGITAVVIMLVVQWLPGILQIVVAVPIGVALIFWALQNTTFDPFGRASNDGSPSQDGEA